MGALSGRVEGGIHHLPIRVYYEDTDTAGIVYYANYLKFAERARTELLRLAGINQSEMAARYGMAFAVRNCAVDFRAPARLDDLIEVRSRFTELVGATVSGVQAIGATQRSWCASTCGSPACAKTAVQREFPRLCVKR